MREKFHLTEKMAPVVINIDDEPAIVHLLDFVINKEFQITTLKFTDSRKVIEYYKCNLKSPSIIITNEIMTFLKGRDLLKKIDTIVQAPVYAILHSGHLAEIPGGVEDFFNTKYQWIKPIRFFTKPIDMREMVKVLSDLFSVVIEHE
jgi:hypothetical protein